MTATIVVLAITLSFTIILLILKIRGERHIASKLKAFNSEETQELLKKSPYITINNELINEINNTLTNSRKNKINYLKLEKELKIAIENISHDLRTPLTSILGYLELLSESNLTPEERLNYIFIVENRAKILKELITNFHSISKEQASDYTLTLEKVDLQIILTNSLASFYNNFINKNINPQINIEDIDLEILGNPIAINRIFSNLLNNILIHGNNQVEINLFKKSNKIITTFKNQATNLTDDDVKYIFDRFYTNNKSIKKDCSGIGLSITKSLVEKQGHKIYCKKENGNLVIIIEWCTYFEEISSSF